MQCAGPTLQKSGGILAPLFITPAVLFWEASRARNISDTALNLMGLL